MVSFDHLNLIKKGGKLTMTNFYSTLRTKLNAYFTESTNGDYKNRHWDYSSIRYEIDRIMDAHASSYNSLNKLEALKDSVRIQMFDAKNPYTKKSLRNGFMDINSCIRSIENYIRSK